MPLNVKQLLQDQRGRNYELFGQHVNPQFAKVLKTIGFDRCYVKAQGPYLWDVEGKQYLDFLGGYAVFNMGRNHPDIRQALTDFLEEEYPSMVQMDAPLLAGVLAKELLKRTPNGLENVFFTNSGTEGVECAIKYARCATGRPAIVHCKKAFHGLSNGSLSLNGDDSFRKGFAPFLPECRQIPFDDLAALEQALASRDVAAFIVEPIQGKGVNVPQPGFLKQAGELCRKYGSLLVADEVQTGVGRTGRFFAYEWDEADPDIVVLSKALSGGYVPVGAVLTRRSIYDKVFTSMDRAVVHSSTFGKGNFAMVAGLASLQVLDEYKLLDNANRMGALIREGLEAMMPRYEFMHSVRQRGLMVGITFGQPKSLGLRTAWSLIHKMDANLFPQAVVIPLLDDHRILTQVAGHHIDIVKLLPPLVISEEDVRWFLRGFEEVMKGLHKFPGPVWEVLTKLGKHAVTKRAREQSAT